MGEYDRMLFKSQQRIPESAIHSKDSLPVDKGTQSDEYVTLRQWLIFL